MSAVLKPVADAIHAPALPSIQHPLLRQLLDGSTPLLHELLDGLGSPLHLMLPQVLEVNASAFNAALREAGVEGQVLYAKKANKARCVVARCAALGLGVDAASVPEAAGALAAGVPGRHIGISGPAKHPELLRLAMRQECLVAMDSLEEVQRCADAAAAERRQVRVLLRWRPPSQFRSRFGMLEVELEQAVALCSQRRSALRLEGFSFHLSGYDAMQRADAAHALIARCAEARSLGLSCDTINIGGGFAVRYVEESAWAAFMAEQSEHHYHAGRTFDGFYPYASACPGAAMLGRILSHATAGRSLADRLRDGQLRLLLEPGRALLDQAGVTLFRVQGVKDRAGDGYGIVTVDGMSFSMSEQWFNSEYLPNPVLLGEAAGLPYLAAVAGTSCLDSDMVTWRKLRLPRRPRVGDALLYPNTAGYQMDSNESPFHDLPLPRKVVVEFDEACRPRWRLDDAAPICQSFPPSH